MSVSPMRCVTLPRWLTRGMFSSVGWLPFLNCASALAARRPNPASPPQRLRTHFDILLITAPSSLVGYDLVSPLLFERDTPALEGRPRGGSVSSETEEKSRGFRGFIENLEEMRDLGLPFASRNSQASAQISEGPRETCASRCWLRESRFSENGGRNRQRLGIHLNEFDARALRRFPKVYGLALGIDFMTTMTPVPFGKLYGSALMLDDFPPTAAVVGAKTDFTLGDGHRSRRIANSCEVIIESVLEPHAVKDHEPKATVVGIGFLRPVLTAPGDPIEAVGKQTPKLWDSET